MPKLENFFCVTETSVYEVFASGAEGCPCPYAEKIALKGDSKIAVGGKVSGIMIAIARNLQPFTPEGHAFVSPATSFVRDLAKVNTHWWGVGTSPIVALFLDKEEALACLTEEQLQPCDARWVKQTMAVLNEIGDDHPNFSICTSPRIGLPLVAVREN